MSDDTEIKYLRIEISDKGTIEVSGTAEFVDSLSALFVSGIAKNVQYRAQRKDVLVTVEAKKMPKSSEKGGKK